MNEEIKKKIEYFKHLLLFFSLTSYIHYDPCYAFLLSCSSAITNLIDMPFGKEIYDLSCQSVLKTLYNLITKIFSKESLILTKSKAVSCISLWQIMSIGYKFRPPVIYNKLDGAECDKISNITCNQVNLDGVINFNLLIMVTNCSPLWNNTLYIYIYICLIGHL